MDGLHPTRRRGGPGERRYGRQAEAERNDRLVLDAAREVFAEQGSAAPVSAVAARAGVGMGTLYRRYGSKEELLQRLCVLAMEQSIASAEEALAADTDGWGALALFVRRCVDARGGALGPIAGSIPVSPEMTATSERGRRLSEELVAHAQRDRTVRRDVGWIDVANLIEFASKLPRRTEDEVNAAERLLAIALDGLRDHGQPALPGAMPTWERYSARWYDFPAT
ncbi:TetR/AcrR family transcriptional regulator [Streptosporangium carneum]|nr:helix-turn-helix domain-containing protein [Streptosporangium carneum]